MPVAAVSPGDWADPVSGAPRDPTTGLPKRVVARVSGLELVLVPAGSYERGSNPRPEGRWVPPDEQPAHRVSISQPFYLGATKVTQAEWTKVAGLNPSRFRKDGDFPVEGISFVDVASYLRHVQLRLPSEAEWEHACKAGGDDPVAGSADPRGALAEIGWYVGNSGRSTQPLNLKRENQLGLKDLLGDVTEWTSSRYDPAEYRRSVPSVTDPRGPEEGNEIVVRGCTFISPVEQCRCAQRGHANPQTRNFIGLRVAHDAL
jgi:formylglycine-generating enzyme required for sulfatase activity